jgi:histidinol-phosphate/aromatic aminotransferase/cobyric acid decarboxylase-like protein
MSDGAGVKLAGWDATNWDLNTQQPHGGQEWSSMGDTFVSDFSVTTNFLGPPAAAVAAAASSLQHLEHYPAANFEPALTHCADFVAGADGETSAELKSRLLLGNGASELIDLVTRLAAPAGGFQQGSSTVQYKEYERAAMAAQPMKFPSVGSSFSLAPADPSGARGSSMSLAQQNSSMSLASLDEQASVEEDNDRFAILAVVNPCNPTGEYLSVEELKAYITAEATERGKPGCCVLVDESMQLWHSEHWRQDSLVSQRDWIQSMWEEKGVSVYVIHSWTKIWSCPGIRLGSILTPTAGHAQNLKSHQVPWSVNVCALAFLSAAIADEAYLRRTWDLTPRHRQATVDELKDIPAFANWDYLGAPWTSWIWIDTGDSKQAAAVVACAKAAGCPIRAGAMGYKMPTFLRFAVRAPEHQRVLFAALRAHFGAPTRAVDEEARKNPEDPSRGSVWRTIGENLEWALKFSSQ